MLPNKIIEDIARRVARDEMSRGSREEDILRRKIDTLAENQRNLAEDLAEIDDELRHIINNPPKSLLTNGTFELDTNKDGIADGWEFGGTATDKTASMAEAAIGGTRCQRISIGANNTIAGGTAYVKQTVPINVHKRYTFSLFHKDDGIEQMSYYIVLRKKYIGGIFSDIVLHSESYTDWGHRIVATFDGEDEITEVEVYIGISVPEAGIAANAWFDAAVLNYGSHPIQPPHTIGVEDFVGDIKPPRLVSSLPLLPHADYPIGSVVFLIDERRLYTNDNEEWVSLSAATFEDIEGQITETQISNGAITTPKLGAGAVTAEKLHAEAITADTIMAGIIAAGGITSDYIASGTIMAELVAAGEITTDEIVIKSGDGKTIFSGNTLEVRDTNNVVRVRLGRLS